MSDLAEITQAASRMHLPFLLAGGHAVITHGYARVTFDLDLIIRGQEKDKWRSLATSTGYLVHHEGPAFVQFNPVDKTRQALDLMLVGESTFAGLEAEAVVIRQQGLDIRVVSLRHLLALKCHAIRHTHAGRTVKDADDVIQLIQVNRIDVNEPSWREWLLKYGTNEIYEKLRRVCRIQPDA